jgi:Flp pilus assembly protein TadD
LKGKKLLDNGDYAAAVEQFKTATKLLPANAQAWNYLGVAEQHIGDSADAISAYQRALTLDRDLMEAHYNLGQLWLEQNKFPDAKIEFTAYTLRRGNAPEGWLKLGAAQLRAGEIVSAEKSFSTAHSLDPNNAEALNGLGLARIQRNRPRDAAQFFAVAIQNHPDDAPAILNLATVNHDYLHDDKTALEYYRKYLALTPRPDNWDAVNAIADKLESSGTLVVASPPAAVQTVAPPAPAAETKPQQPAHFTNSPKPQPVPVRTAAAPRSQTSGQVQVVQVEPEPVIMATPNSAAPATETPSQKTPSKLNPLNWFSSTQKTSDTVVVTPLPTEHYPAANTQKPIKIVPPAPPTFPRYVYLSRRRAPSPGPVKLSRNGIGRTRWNGIGARRNSTRRGLRPSTILAYWPTV